MLRHNPPFFRGFSRRRELLQGGPDLTWFDGDFNNDGYVNDIDAALLSANWHSGVTGGNAAVPEPGMLSLFVLGGLCLAVRSFVISKKQFFTILTSSRIRRDKMRRVFYVTTILSGIMGFLTSSAQSKDIPEIVSVQKIWDNGKYNLATDLIHFKNRWWCTFREAESHGGGSGKIRIIVSDNGENWTSSAILAEEGFDLRDPHLSVMPDGRLMCIFGASIWSYDGKNTWDGKSAALTRSPRVSFSADGREWTKPRKVLAEDHWLWRVTWHNGRAWCMSKLGEGKEPRRIMLYSSTNGLDWQWVTEPRLPDNAWNGSETTLRFLPDDTMVALTRPEWIGTSRPPYHEWEWTRIRPKPKNAGDRTGEIGGAAADFAGPNFAANNAGDRTGEIGGPNFIRLPDGSLWGSGRYYGRQKKTVLARMTPTSFTPVLELPSGGDNSYPGMVYNEDDGLLWMSYYSSHEGKISIYLAKIRIPMQK